MARAQLLLNTARSRGNPTPPSIVAMRSSTRELFVSPRVEQQTVVPAAALIVSGARNWIVGRDEPVPLEICTGVGTFRPRPQSVGSERSVFCLDPGRGSRRTDIYGSRPVSRDLTSVRNVPFAA